MCNFIKIKRNCLFFRIVFLFCILASSVWEFQLLCTFSNLVLQLVIILVILVGIEWYLTLILICISVMTVFVSLFAIHLCVFFGEVFVQVFAHFKLGWLFPYCWVLRVLHISEALTLIPMKTMYQAKMSTGKERKEGAVTNYILKCSLYIC